MIFSLLVGWFESRQMLSGCGNYVRDAVRLNSFLIFLLASIISSRVFFPKAATPRLVLPSFPIFLSL